MRELLDFSVLAILYILIFTIKMENKRKRYTIHKYFDVYIFIICIAFYLNAYYHIITIYI